MRTTRVYQAYEQAPWRVQIQHVGLFLLGLVIVALAAGVYLYISGLTAQTGVEIQAMDSAISKLNRKIADKESQLAYLLSASEMEQRAVEMGFAPITSEQIVYARVPGYPGRDVVTLAPPPNRADSAGPVIRTEYTRSLWEWFMKDVVETGLTLSEVIQ